MPRLARAGETARVVLAACGVLTLLAAAVAPGATRARPPKVLVLGTPEPRPSAEVVSAPADDDDAAEIAVAQASLVETVVEVRREGRDWARLAEGGRVHTGDRLRTGADSVARIDFPWMSASLGPASELVLAKSRLLGLRLEAGRVEMTSERDDLVKLDTPEARVRGRGHVIVRRDGTTTLVSLLHGEARVTARRGSTGLKEGQGCRVLARGACVALPLPEPPSSLTPGADPTYVAVGRPLSLAWSAAAASFHVQVLSFDGEASLSQRDVPTPPFEVAIPWPGLYRFRVSARSPEGLEGRPSLEGLFQVMPPDWLKSGSDARP